MIKPHLTAVQVPVKRKSGISMEIRYKNLSGEVNTPLIKPANSPNEELINTVNQAFKNLNLLKPVVQNSQIKQVGNKEFLEITLANTKGDLNGSSLENLSKQISQYIPKKYLNSSNVSCSIINNNIKITVELKPTNNTDNVNTKDSINTSNNNPYNIPIEELTNNVKNIFKKLKLPEPKVITSKIIPDYMGEQHCSITLDTDFSKVQFLHNLSNLIQKDIQNHNNVLEPTAFVTVRKSEEFPKKVVISTTIKEEHKVPNIPITFTDDWEAFVFFENTSYDNWKNSLTNKEALSIMAYTSGGDSISRLINTYLREQPRGEFRDDSVRYKGKYSQEEYSSIKEFTSYLDSAIEKSELSEPIQTFRAVQSRNEDGSIGMFEKLKNAYNSGNPIFVDEAYCSTTAVSGSFESMNSTGVPIIFRIKIPAGKGVGAWIRPYSSYPEENEFLLARGSQFKILTDMNSIEEEEFTVIDLELVGNIQPPVLPHTINDELPPAKIQWNKINHEEAANYLD